MSINKLDSVGVVPHSNPQCAIPRDTPDLEGMPLHVQNVAALRGLGYSFREIGRTYGVTPQAASVMLARQRVLLERQGRRSEMKGLSPRAVNCLGRLGICTRGAAREAGNLETRLHSQRNCGEKTIREILDWAGLAA